jgi:hypothetical protein
MVLIFSNDAFFHVFVVTQINTNISQCQVKTFLKF